jgi:hypothetical protein
MGLLNSIKVNHTDNTQYTTNHNKTIVNQPPSEEVVKMIKEASSSAEKRVLDSFKINNSWCQISVVVFFEEYMQVSHDSPSLKYLFKISLNGNEKIFKFDLDSYEVRKLKGNHKHNEVLIKIIKVVSDYISLEMIKEKHLEILGIEN